MDRWRHCTTGSSLLLVSVVVWATFGNTLLNGFVWDDNVLIVGNSVYATFDLYRIVSSLANGLEYLPVRDLSYAVDYRLWGQNPAGFHFSNVACYWFLVVAVYFVARETSKFLLPAGEETGRRAMLTGLTTGLLFAVHPIHSEVVSFITCRNALLSTLLFFCACYLYLAFITRTASGRMRHVMYLGAFLCFAASLLSKATGIVLPLILACYALSYRAGRRISLLGVVPFLLLAIAAFIFFKAVAVQTHVISGVSGWSDLGGWLSHLATAVQIVGFYVGKLAVPFGYSSEYDVSFRRAFTEPAVWGNASGLLAAAVLAWRMRKTRPYLLFSLVWFLITLVPVLNFLPTAPVVADRYALLPSFGFFFLLAGLMVELSTRVRPACAASSAIALILVWGGIALACNKIWYSNQTLWENTIKVSPGSINAYTNLGRTYFEANHNDDRAFALFAKAQENNPGDPHLDYFMGLREYFNGDTPGAIRHLNRAIGRDIEFIEALYQLGTIYEKTGEPDKARAYYRLVLSSRYMDTGTSLRAEAVAALRRLGAAEI